MTGWLMALQSKLDVQRESFLPKSCPEYCCFQQADASPSPTCVALPGIGGGTPSTASLPVRHLQFANGAHCAGELGLPRWTAKVRQNCLSPVRRSCGRSDKLLISCLGAKSSPVKCAARPAAGEVAQEGTAAETQAAPSTGALACSMFLACLVLLTCLDHVYLLTCLPAHMP
jgi:hypothetical protein